MNKTIVVDEAAEVVEILLENSGPKSGVVCEYYELKPYPKTYHSLTDGVYKLM